jgi:hypothetical protein
MAPWDHVQLLCNKVDELITVIREKELVTPTPTTIEFPDFPEYPEMPGWEPLTERIDSLSEKVDALIQSSSWTAKEPEEIFRQSITTSGTFYTDKMVDWTKGKRLVLKINSALDKDVSIQVIGNINNAKDGATDIGVSQTCLANDAITINPGGDFWHPYIGIKITVPTAPTKGTLYIWSVIQE